MNWSTVIQLIITYGIDQAFAVWAIARQHGEPDEAAWEKLRALSLKTYDEYIREAQERLRAKQELPPDATKPDV